MSSLDKLEQELNLAPTDYNIFCNSLTMEKQESMEHNCSIEPEEEILSRKQFKDIVDFYGEESGVRIAVNNLIVLYKRANAIQKAKIQQLFLALKTHAPAYQVNDLNEQLKHLYKENE